MSAAGWLVDALIASTLLMGAVLIARGPVRRAFGPQCAYALWALPLLRFFLPSLPAGWWRAAAATPVTRAGETITVLIIEPARAVAAAPLPPAWLGPGLALAWAAGAAAFLVFHLVRHRRFCRRLLTGAEPVEQGAGEIGGVIVLASAAAPGPLAFGVWRRYVAFPRDFAERYDAEERALALAHELGHHARRDLLANWAALAVLALHWFNPLAWRAFHAFRADQELANDARVLAGRSPEARHAYGRAIVKAAHGGSVSAACHLHTIADLKGRLRMLTTSRASRRRLAAGAAAVSLLIVGGLGVTASSSSAAAAITESVGDAFQVAPTPPAVPATTPEIATPVDLPPAPPMPATSTTKKRVVVVKDGKTTTYEGADADRYIAANDLPVPPAPPAVAGRPGEPRVMTLRRLRTDMGKGGLARSWVVDVPEITNATCPGDAARPVVENSVKDGKRRIVICTNRMELMTREAERIAANSGEIERNARLTARSSLAMARSAIERDRNLSDNQRREALAGIADAEAELTDDAKD